MRIPALALEDVDPTGAGDRLCVTFVTSCRRGMGAADSRRHADASGARAVGRGGLMEGTSTLAELDGFIARACAPGLDPAAT